MISNGTSVAKDKCIQKYKGNDINQITCIYSTINKVNPVKKIK